jgi:hypothetical protein
MMQGADAVPDDDLKTLFSRLQSDQPPTGIQADDLIRRGHQVRRRRKAAAVAGGSLAAASVVVLFWQWTGPVQPSPAPVVPATRPASTRTPPPISPSCPTVTTPALTPGSTFCVKPSGR